MVTSSHDCIWSICNWDPNEVHWYPLKDTAKLQFSAENTHTGLQQHLGFVENIGNLDQNFNRFSQIIEKSNKKVQINTVLDLSFGRLGPLSSTNYAKAYSCF